ncbi:hypothetical protein NDU88_006979 [Pleurodeles waltl]|uniref:Uncharacterized protein n=1 Tax=Pleurodeles waltl TaxID=8319 RepID=A0AAV7PMG4_PLEWA|nr:hypothetical protein NDU88_006979 [Pleurodeles waltl]
MTSAADKGAVNGGKAARRLTALNGLLVEHAALSPPPPCTCNGWRQLTETRPRGGQKTQQRGRRSRESPRRTRGKKIVMPMFSKVLLITGNIEQCTYKPRAPLRNRHPRTPHSSAAQMRNPFVPYDRLHAAVMSLLFSSQTPSSAFNCAQGTAQTTRLAKDLLYS